MTSQPAHFQTTLWSGVIHAAALVDGEEEHPASSGALAELCRRYWRPLFIFARMRGASEEDAEDSTQAFFARLVARRELLRRADPERGKFRTFLLHAFKNHLADEQDRRNSQKRGGGQSIVSMEMDVRSVEIADTATTPDVAFDLQWAREVVRRATEALRMEYVEAGRGEWFDLVGNMQGPQRSLVEIAGMLGTSEEAVKSFALRMRRRLKLLLERQIADTVSTPQEVAEEVAYIGQLLRGPVQGGG